MNGKKKKCPEKNKSRTLNRLSCIYLKCMEKKLTSYLCRHLTFLAIRLVSTLMWTGATECLFNVQMPMPYWVTGRVNLETHSIKCKSLLWSRLCWEFSYFSIAQCYLCVAFYFFNEVSYGEECLILEIGKDFQCLYQILAFSCFRT